MDGADMHRLALFIRLICIPLNKILEMFHSK